MATQTLNQTNRKELQQVIVLTLAVILMFSPSYIADIAMRRLKLDIGIAAGVSFGLFLIGIFLLIRNTKR